jgi:hypothetical protein
MVLQLLPHLSQKKITICIGSKPLVGKWLMVAPQQSLITFFLILISIKIFIIKTNYENDEKLLQTNTKKMEKDW